MQSPFTKAIIAPRDCLTLSCDCDFLKPIYRFGHVIAGNKSVQLTKVSVTSSCIISEMSEIKEAN